MHGHHVLCLAAQEAGRLEIELQTVVSSHADAGNQTRVHWKSRQCSMLLIHLSLQLHLQRSYPHTVEKGGKPRCRSGT